MEAIWRLNSGFYSNLELSNYSDKNIWVPIISYFQNVKIETWEIGLELMEFYSNLNVQVDKPSVVSELNLVFDKFHEYEIYINDEFHSFISQMDFTESTTIRFFEFLRLLKSIKIKASKGEHRNAITNLVKIKAFK